MFTGRSDTFGLITPLHERPVNRRGRARRPATTAIPVLKELFDLADERGITITDIAHALNTLPNLVSGWRYGKNTPSTFATMELAAALGKELTLK
ncbi:cro-like repressor protein [Rhizobium phage RHph_Y5A]|nr:cro-like repressor protein [Rhizobium phage RHph_Y5A]QIG75547.1 cro-like repressor protein [Rhizobium phage RHph_Y2_4]